MQSTIGEIVDQLLPYSNSVDSVIINDIPFVRAYISNDSNITRAILYVVQTQLHEYSVCDAPDEILGNRVFPTGSISKPFISESSFINDMFGIKNNTSINTKNKLSASNFLKYLMDRTWYYDVTRFNPSNFRINMSEMGFNNSKLRHVINRSFSENGRRDGTLEDLMNIVVVQHKKFNLNPLKEKDIRCISAKLKNVGIIITSDNGYITGVTFERRK